MPQFRLSAGKLPAACRQISAACRSGSLPAAGPGKADVKNAPILTGRDPPTVTIPVSIMMQPKPTLKMCLEGLIGKIVLRIKTANSVDLLPVSAEGGEAS